MRTLLLLAAVLAACAKAATPSTAAPAASASPASAPGVSAPGASASVASASAARLTSADVAGTWRGTTWLQGTDSVLGRWTARGRDSTIMVLYEGEADSVRYRVTYDADSMVAVSAPYAHGPGGPVLADRAVGRLQNGKLVGVASANAAAKPDSTVVRTRWEATRTP
jgi:hypothetical protein